MYKIAIVEDEKNLAALVLKYLCTEGYEVKLYSNGEEALQDADICFIFTEWKEIKAVPAEEFKKFVRNLPRKL